MQLETQPPFTQEVNAQIGKKGQLDIIPRQGETMHWFCLKTRGATPIIAGPIATESDGQKIANLIKEFYPQAKTVNIRIFASKKDQEPQIIIGI